MRAGWLVVVAALLAGCTHQPDPDPDPAPSAPVADPLFVCGRGVFADDVKTTRDPLTVAFASVRRSSPDAAPEVTLRFTATTDVRVEVAQVEVLYLIDLVIVGGGPMLNQPGDFSPQGVDLPGTGFEVGPGRPVDFTVATRPTLCPAFTWPKLWSTPGDVSVAAVVGSLEPRSGGLLVNAPGPGAPLLAVTTPLPR